MPSSSDPDAEPERSREANSKRLQLELDILASELKEEEENLDDPPKDSPSAPADS